MCGIWGIFNKKPEDWLSAAIDSELAKTMMIVSSLRGDHSTGVAFIPYQSNQSWTTEKAPKIIRTVGGPFGIFHTKEGIEAFKKGIDIGGSVFGHNRLATRGAIKLANAHPFHEGDWTLVHNGTLRSGVKTEEGVEVDSHALCLRFGEVGIKEALLSIDGAYAIIAYNHKEKKIYLARNAERPLFMFTHGKYVYAMSEKESLEYCLHRHNRYYHTPEIESKYPVELKPSILYLMSEEGLVEHDSVRQVVKNFYTPPANVNEEQSDYGTITKPEKDEEIYFKVSYITKHGNLYKLLAFTADRTEVVCYAQENRNDLINSVGCGRVHSIITDKHGKRSLMVKFSKVIWGTMDDVDDRDPVGPHLLTKLAEKCIQCGEEIIRMNYAVETESGNHICEDCVETWLLSNPNPSVKALMQ